jgi:phosphoadenosine phosphosulfate reductase
LWSETERRYGRRIRAIYPDHVALEQLVARQGIDGFYASKHAREDCCDVRKTRPLDRMLDGASAWIAGLRSDQSSARRDAGLVSFEKDRNVIKVNPLFDWTREAVMAVVQANKIPINPLHAKGFASIGCAPCTRAIAPGEPERNGRWWWENSSSRECGLHLPRRRNRTPKADEQPAAYAGCG